MLTLLAQVSPDLRGPGAARLPSQTMAAEPRTDAAGPEAPAAAAAGRTPLALVIDEDISVRRFVSLILQGSGVDTIEFADGDAFRGASAPNGPAEADLVFIDVALDTQDAIHSLEALGTQGFRGQIQLMSGRGAAVLESIKSVGEQQKLKMLKGLKKPFDAVAVQRIVQELKLAAPAPGAARIGLGEALKNNWIEFWYQPKVDLRRKTLAGAEAFARVRHPQFGVLKPGSFMPGADDASLDALSALSIETALRAGKTFAQIGVNIRIAINIALPSLSRIPVGELVQRHRPDAAGWPGLIVDLTEEQVIPALAQIGEIAARIAPFNVKLAIDDFGRGYASLSSIKALPFAEMKLDRSFVADCGSDKVNAPVCKTVINLAHSFGAVATGIGIEKASDMLALVSMGCDLGQGFLLGQPMPEERFVALLRQRAPAMPAGPAAARA